MALQKDFESRWKSEFVVSVGQQMTGRGRGIRASGVGAIEQVGGTIDWGIRRGNWHIRAYGIVSYLEGKASGVGVMIGNQVESN